MTAKRRSGFGVVALGAGIAVVTIVVGYSYFVVLPLVGIAVLGSVTRAWSHPTIVGSAMEKPIADDRRTNELAVSAYDVRLTEPSATARKRTGWSNAINNVMCSLSGMATASPDPGPRASQPKTDVEIIYIPSGAVVARLRAPLDTAQGLVELITRDLQSLSAFDFEGEWNVTPTAVPQRPR